MTANRLATCRISLVLALALTGCDAPAADIAAASSGAAAARPAAGPEALRPSPAASANTSQDTALDTTVLRALSGGHSSTADVVATRGGISCSPATIRSLAPDLTLTLPADAAARDHPLIVVTPERGWMSIYQPDNGAAGDGEDVIQPSDVIIWPIARDRARFAFRAEELGGLGLRDAAPAAAFLEAGRYVFALVTGTDAELMALDGKRPRVLASCAFDWTPEVG